jgi:hypothetical protein
VGLFITTAGLRGMKCRVKAWLDPLSNLDKFFEIDLINTVGVIRMANFDNFINTAGLRGVISILKM